MAAGCGPAVSPMVLNRVASSCNPVDGLSRGKVDGPWHRVQQAYIPKGFLAAIRDELRGSGVHV